MIKLSSKKYTIARFKRTTRTQGLKDLSAGDKIEFSLTLSRKTKSRGNYATWLTIDCKEKGITFGMSQTEVVNMLNEIIAVEECTEVDDE